MHIKKDENKNTWEVFLYIEDHTGKKKLKHKRGFKTKREAVAWAEQFKQKQNCSIDMKFEDWICELISEL